MYLNRGIENSQVRYMYQKQLSEMNLKDDSEQFPLQQFHFISTLDSISYLLFPPFLHYVRCGGISQESRCLNFL